MRLLDSNLGLLSILTEMIDLLQKLLIVLEVALKSLVGFLSDFRKLLILFAGWTASF